MPWRENKGVANLDGIYTDVFLDSSQNLIYKQQRAEGPMTSLAQGNTLRT
mgnify:CR=1 FL=1